MSDSEDIKNYDDLPVWTPESSEIVFGTSEGELGEKIPSLRLESWEHFTPFISDPMFHDPESEFIFRGQRRSDWRLMPSLSRNTSDGIITKKLADKQLANFKKAARGRLSDSNIVSEEDELWAIGQHYGLKTPLLDWSYSPYVALFFAFFQADSVLEVKDNQYRAVYVLNKDRLDKNFNDLNVKILEPTKDDQGRLVSQAGLFTVSPQDATFENKIVDVVTQDSFLIDGKRYGELRAEEGIQALARFVCKVYIKNDSPQGCIRLLRRMNVHHASLFPDLIGASEYCNLLIDESGVGSKGKTIKVEPIIERKHVTEVAKLATPVVDYSHSSKDLFTPYAAKTVNELLVASLATLPIVSDDLLDLSLKLQNTLEEYKVIDWQVKDSAHARFKNITRTMLRNYNVPEKFRMPIVEQIVETMIREDENKEEQ